MATIIGSEDKANLLTAKARYLYDTLGQTKKMGHASPVEARPHYFLLRTFKGENDLLVIFNTKRCRYQCFFCQLPAKSSRTLISGDELLSQFDYVLDEEKHALS